MTVYISIYNLNIFLDNFVISPKSKLHVLIKFCIDIFKTSHLKTRTAKLEIPPY